MIPDKRNTLTDLMSIKIIFKFLPIKSSFPLGFVSANIQANDRAMVAMRTANTASSFLTPYIVLKKEKHETAHHRNNGKKQLNLSYQLQKQEWVSIPLQISTLRTQKQKRQKGSQSCKTKEKDYQSDAVIMTPAQSGKNPLLRIRIAMALPMTS